ncbi:MAG: hypothetical protein ACUVUR_07120 [bacterium]
MAFIVVSLIAGLIIPPGAGFNLCQTETDGIILKEVLNGSEFADSVIELGGVWGITVSMGNVDTDPEPEIGLRVAKVAGSSYISRLVMLDDDLRELWSREIGDIGNVEVAGFSLADLNGDGSDEVVFPLTDVYFNSEPRYKARVYALDGKTGADLPGWPYILPGWPEDPYLRPYSEVVVCDLDGDGRLEIVCEVADLNSIRKCGSALYCFSAGGDSLWKTWFYQDTIYRHGQFTKPAVCDLDGDGRLEVVCHEAKFNNDYPWNLLERRLFIVNYDGSIRRSVQTEGQGSSFVPDYAAPTVADLDQDDNWEIIVLRRGGFLDVFDTALIRLSGFPVNLTDDAGYLNPSLTRCFSTPAAADIDLDGDLEIIVGSFGQVGTGGDWGGHVHCFHHNGARVDGFPYETRNGVWYSPGVADVDTTRPGLEILTSGCDSAFYIITSSGESLPGWPKRGFPTYWLPDQGSHAFIEGKIPLSKTPQLGDIDRDGYIEIMMTGADGRFYFWDAAVAFDSARMPVATYHFDQKRTGWNRMRPIGVEDDIGSRTTSRHATVVQKQLFISSPDDRPGITGFLLNAAGSRVASLRSGVNDIGFLSPGVYFIKPVSGAVRIVGKVMIVR